MVRTCPYCKSENVRRSKVRRSETTLRYAFRSPHRCRDCRKRFWTLSNDFYYLVGVVGVTMAVGVVAWNLRNLIEFEFPFPERAPATTPTRNVADLTRRANANDPVAEYELARMYAIGDGVAKSLRNELNWLERAARHGNVEAQYEYGVALRDGRGTVQDYEAARKWIQLAAEGSSGPAQFALGMMNRAGLGIPVDNIKAYVWLNLAAAQGVPGAAAARDSLLANLTPAELQDAQAEARRLSAIHLPKSGPTP